MLKISVLGIASGREMESNDSREKIVLRVSKRGRITVSLYAVRTMRRTSRAWLAGILFAEEDVRLFEEEMVDVGKAPQKSDA